MSLLSKWISIALLCICLLPALCGCAGEPAAAIVPTASTTVPARPALTALEQYEQARTQIDSAENLILTYTMSQSRLTGGDTYTEVAAGTASFSGIGQPSMTAIVEEKLTCGTYESAYTEGYRGGTAFAQTGGSSFSADLTPQEFVERQIPAVLLNGALYDTVTAQPGENTTVITFADASRPEDWLVGSQTAELVTAQGTATLDGTGALLQTTLQAEWILGDARYICDVTVRVTAPQSLELDAVAPELSRDAVRLESLDAPKMLLRAVGDIYASEDISCQAVETIYSEVIPLSYTQQSEYTLSGAAEELTASAQYVISLSDYRGEVSTRTQTDRFEDGVFTSAVDGKDPEPQAGVTAQAVREHCEDAILSALFAPKYLSGAVLEETQGEYRLELQGNDAFTADLMADIASFLQLDLDATAQAVQTGAAGGYLTVDKDTGLPVAMGLRFQRVHTLDSVAYTLTYELDHTLRLSAGEE